MDVLARMEGFSVCILFLLLYFFVACEHLGIAIYSPIPVEPKMGAKIKYFSLVTHVK